jgi:predicted nucleic acid-binding protein
MTKRIYLDTSVYGGYFDKEFQELTKRLFIEIGQNKFKVLVSSLTINELLFAPIEVNNLLKNLSINETEILSISQEANSLAEKYISNKVVGETSFSDCLHIAIATINNADSLVSWNFKHIVNVRRIIGYNTVNLEYGYKSLRIESPIGIYEKGN